MNRDTAVAHWVAVGFLAGATLLHVVQHMTSKKKDDEEASAAAAAQTIIRAPGANKPWRMSKFVKYGSNFKIQGLVGDIDKIPGSSIGEQTAQALAKLDAILSEANLTKKNLTSIAIYVADYDKDTAPMNEVYDKWVDKEAAPVRICVQAYMGKFGVELQAEGYCR